MVMVVSPICGGRSVTVETLYHSLYPRQLFFYRLHPKRSDCLLPLPGVKSGGLTTEELMDIQPFFDLLGKQSAVARAFGVTDAAVLKWKRAGRIPAHRVDAGRAILAATPAAAPAAPEAAVIASGAIVEPVVE
jgi:hypothetical protein